MPEKNTQERQNKTTQEKQTYSAQQAARLAGLNTSTVRHYCRIGLIRCTRGYGFGARISQDELELLNHLLAMRHADLSCSDMADLADAYRNTKSGTAERAEVMRRMAQAGAVGVRDAAACYMRLEDELAAELAKADG